MAKKSKADKYTTAKERLELGKRWRYDEGYDDKWHRMIDLYRGKTYFDAHTDGADRISVNLAFSTVNVISPSVAVNHPKITVTPNRAEDADRAIFVESIVNYMWRHHDFR